MTKYLADTCLLIDFENQQESAVRFVEAHHIHVSTVSIMEFDQGYKLPFSKVFKNARVIDLSHTIASLAASKIATLRALKTPKGKPLYNKEMMTRLSFDAMVAATAIEHNLTVLTNNTKDFKLFKNVKIKTI
jgi:predicted nucleic acid-binding protein